MFKQRERERCMRSQEGEGGGRGVSGLPLHKSHYLKPLRILSVQIGGCPPFPFNSNRSLIIYLGKKKKLSPNHSKLASWKYFLTSVVLRLEVFLTHEMK